MATIELKLSPFPVPTSVTVEVPSTGKRQDGLRPSVVLNLNELDSATVEQMIADFAEAVMARAATKE